MLTHGSQEANRFEKQTPPGKISSSYRSEFLNIERYLRRQLLGEKRIPLCKFNIWNRTSSYSCSFQMPLTKLPSALGPASLFTLPHLIFETILQSTAVIMGIIHKRRWRPRKVQNGTLGHTAGHTVGREGSDTLSSLYFTLPMHEQHVCEGWPLEVHVLKAGSPDCGALGSWWSL